VWALVYATGFTHANLRWNAGAFGWLLVTPQSHRIHHSTEERHWEKNFGAILSVWDRLFRKQWHGTDDYPTIGIDDTAFPLEQAGGPRAGRAQLLPPGGLPVQARRRRRAQGLIWALRKCRRRMRHSSKCLHHAVRGTRCT
jgi:hypothetical protein